jgi:glycolate oxidase iron-sulfur subunit
MSSADDMRGHSAANDRTLPGASGARARDPIDDCVHCGFCLPHCPTYRLWGEEMDSPRGRIYLMRGLRDGDLPTRPIGASVAQHFDRCLGCMACMPACPSGVRYDVLIERTRAQLERSRPRTLRDRLFRGLLFSVLPYPHRLKLLGVGLWLYARSGLQGLVRRSGLLRRLPPRLAQLDALAPDLRLRDLLAALPAQAPAQGEPRARVGMISGCVQRVFFPRVNQATIRVLAAEGCDVQVPDGQGCCGALSMHAGREHEAKSLARALIDAFDRRPVDFIAINAAGCGSHLKSYGALLADEPAWADRARAFAAKVRDVNELLAAMPPRATRHPLPARVAYHDACHLAHAQGIRAQPRALLRSIPGLTLIEIPDGDQCCGSAGTYNLTEPEASDAIGARKVDNVMSTGAQVLAAANAGCTLQIQKLLRARGVALPAAHPIEILDAAIRGVPLQCLGGGIGIIPGKT